MTATQPTVNGEPSPSPARPTRGAALRRIVLLVGILAFVFVVVLPRIVDYDAVAGALRTLSLRGRQRHR